MKRITEKQLDAVVAAINNAMNTPQEYYKDGKACVGNYHLDYSYGGVALYQNVKGGGERNVFGGRYTKRELIN